MKSRAGFIGHSLSGVPVDIEKIDAGSLSPKGADHFGPDTRGATGNHDMAAREALVTHCFISHFKPPDRRDAPAGNFALVNDKVVSVNDKARRIGMIERAA